MKDKKESGEIGIKVLLEYANSVMATLREPFLVLDKKLQVISANRVFYASFKVAEKGTIGRLLPDLGNRQWDIPKLLKLLKEIIPERKVVNDYEVEHKFEQIGQRVMILNARQLRVPKKIAGIIASRIRGEGEEEGEGEGEGQGEGEEAGAEELILLAIEDITERKRLENELKESEERYRRAFETSRDGLLLIHKIEGSILNANASAQELLGYSKEELLKMKLWGIGPVKNEKDFQEVASQLEKDGVVNYEDTPVRSKKGRSINAEVFLIDRAKVFQCNIRNITERKEREEALKESEMRFKAIFNESKDGMLLAEAGTRRVFMCNPRICKMLGYTEEEMIHLRVDDIHPEGDLPLVMEQYERQARGEIKLAAGLPVKRKDGSIFYADANTSPITLGGNKYLIGNFRDITDSKRIQDELKEKMQDLERFSNFAVDRELKMEGLEKKVKELEEKLKAR